MMRGYTRLYRLIIVGMVLVFAAGNVRAQTAAPSRDKFPVTTPLAGQGVVKFGGPVLADLDNDGKKEIIFATSGIYNGTSYTTPPKLWVFNNDGTVRTGWPRPLPSAAASSPAVGDIDGDGFPDIVVGCGTNSDLPQAGGVFAFRRDGSPIWSFSPADTDGNGQPDHVWSTPALGDIDGDGILDVVFGSWDFNVYALKGTTGLPLPGWPNFVYDSVWSSPALADLDGDGKLEVIIGADCNTQGPPINIQAGGTLWVFRSNGSLYPGFPKFLVQPFGVAPVGIQSSPAVGDIDGDGCPEIVVGLAQTSLSTGGQQFYAFHNDGSLVAGWPITLAGQSSGSPALADLDGDGVLDVIMTDTGAVIAGRTNSFVYGFKCTGAVPAPLFKVQPKTYIGATAWVVGDAIAAQVGLNNPAILVGGVGFDVTILKKDGTAISDDGTHGGKLTYTTGHPVAGPVVADLDGTGTLTLVAASGVAAGNDTDAELFAWPLGSLGALPWPQFHHDEKRSGWSHVVPTPPSCKPLPPKGKFFPVAPCRIADSRNSGNTTYGGPAYTFNEERIITVTDNALNPCHSIPSTAKAVALNVTVTQPATAGLLRLFPGGDQTPTGSSISYKAGRTRANNTITPLSYDGRGNITVRVEQPAGGVHVILDVSGYFQ
jgi:FG-GAP-like repeat